MAVAFGFVGAFLFPPLSFSLLGDSSDSEE